MKQFTEKEKQYFRENINEFTLDEKSELIDSNLKYIIIDNLAVICKYWKYKEIILKAFELWKFNKNNLKDICKYWEGKEIRIKAFEMWKDLFNKNDLIDICEYWLDKEIKIEAKKLLNISPITKNNFITKL